MGIELKPNPDDSNRRQSACDKRNKASIESRKELRTTNNGEIARFSGVWPTSFTKGLPHSTNGQVDPVAFKMFVSALNENDTKFNVPLGPAKAIGSHRPEGYNEAVDLLEFNDKAREVRGWESPLAGHVFDLEGPDAGSVGMSPAPKLGSDELAAEMAEDYAMAYLRDIDFESIRKQQDEKATHVIQALGALPWFDKNKSPVDADNTPIDVHAKARRKARFSGDENKVTGQSLFRGSASGCMDGPYLSQFLLLGNASREENREVTTYANPAKGYLTSAASRLKSNKDTESREKRTEITDGYISYGAQSIDQRLVAHKVGLDYLTDWASWLDVQNGANTSGGDKYHEEGLRFLTTPRDLATYVHFDALYQAYLNACLFLLGIEAKADAGFPEENNDKTRTPFATFGGPHVLTLVTETATRSLKAVRRQKYNHHLRARPEVIGAVAALAKTRMADCLGPAKSPANEHVTKLELAKDSNGVGLMENIHQHNMDQSQSASGSIAGAPNISGANYLLPMAFPEGSPMHPAYGAGHATVAGSCVTMLKAFFETFKEDENGNETWLPLPLNEVGKSQPIQKIYVPKPDGLSLTESVQDNAGEITLIGELNKLAANISIGRNMAGVHFYSDYYDSLRMGERIAVGMLKEQMLTYPDTVKLRLMSFDDDKITLTTDNAGVVSLEIKDFENNTVSEDDWFSRHVSAPVETLEKSATSTDKATPEIS